MSVCDAVAAWRAYIAAHPDMESLSDPLAFASWPYEGWEGCALPTREPPLLLRLGGPVLDEPCPLGTERVVERDETSVLRGCVGGAPVGDGAFQVDDEGRVFDGWAVREVDGVVVEQARYAQGRQQSELAWSWTEGKPVLERFRTFRSDGHVESDTWFDARGIVAGWAHYRPVYDEDKRLTWLSNGPSTSVLVAETEEEGAPRVVREWLVTDGVTGPIARWVSESWTLDHSAAFRPRLQPYGAPLARCPDPAVLGSLRWATRYSRTTVEIPAGVRRLKVPPGWAVEPGGAAGQVELLVVQHRAWSEGGTAFDPCAGWSGSGVRLDRAGTDWQLTMFGVGETALDRSTVQGIVRAPPGLKGVVDPALYARSEAASGPGLALADDPSHIAEVFGPLLAQENPETYRRNSGRVVFEPQWLPTGDDLGVHTFRVDTDDPAAADALLASLRAHAPALEGCLQPILKAAPDAHGTVPLLFSVEADGSVGVAQVLGGFLDMLRWDRRAKALVPGARACLDERLGEMRFPAGAREVVVEAIVSAPNRRSQLGAVRP